MQPCVICNSNPENIWPKRWQCWKENGKFSESLCKLLGLPKYYEEDLQNSEYCSQCQKKVYNVYLIMRKWDRLQEDISKLKQELETNFHDAFEKFTKDGKQDSVGRGKGEPLGRESKTEEEAEGGKVNSLRRKILKRLSRSHATNSDCDCDCCCDENATKSSRKHHRKKNYCGDKGCVQCGPDNKEKKHRNQKGENGNNASGSGSESGSEYSSAEERDNHDDCDSCCSTQSRDCDDCPLCKEEEAKKKKNDESHNAKKNDLSLRDILTENSPENKSSSSRKTTPTPEAKPIRGSSSPKIQNQSEREIRSSKNTNNDVICNPTDNCMSGDGDESNNQTSGVLKSRPKVPSPLATEPMNNKDVSISSMLMNGGKLFSEMKPTTFSNLMMSQNIPINYKEKRFRCYRSTCISSFSTEEELDIHVKRHHEGVKCPFVCQECGKAYQRRREFNAHMLKHAGKFAVTCHICGRGFRTKALFEMHLKTKHAEGERKYKCTFCDKSFVSESKLKTHLTGHTKEYPYSCSKCSKGFSAKTFLNIHMSKHLDSSPYKCTICLKTFSSPRNLRVHQYTHDQTHPFRCPECSAGMPSEATLKQHMLKHEEEKSHECHVCNRKFQFPSSLKKHLKVHDGDKRFVCEFCNKTFIDKYKLTRHVRTHSGERPYQCTFCFKCFATKDYLHTHVKKHSRAAKGKRVPDSIPSSTISNASDESINSFTLSTNSQSMSISSGPLSHSQSTSNINTLTTTNMELRPPNSQPKSQLQQSQSQSQSSSSMYVLPEAPPAPASSIPSIMTLPEDDHPTQVDELMATIQLENLSSEQLLMMDEDVVDSSPYDTHMGGRNEDVSHLMMDLTTSPLILPSFHSTENLENMLNGDFCELSFQNL